MAPLPTINGVFRVALNWRVGASGPVAVNVIHIYHTAGTSDGVFGALDTNVTTTLWYGIASGTSVYQIQITPLDGTTATSIYAPSGAKWAGTGTQADYVPAAAGVVSLRTAKRGRRYRGRLFLPFIQEGQMLNGSYLTAPTAANTAWTTFLSAMKSGGYPLHIASYGRSLHRTKTSGGGYTMTPVTWTPSSDEVIQATVETTLGTMRNRQGRLR